MEIEKLLMHNIYEIQCIRKKISASERMILDEICTICEKYLIFKKL